MYVLEILQAGSSLPIKNRRRIPEITSQRIEIKPVHTHGPSSIDLPPSKVRNQSPLQAPSRRRIPTYINENMAPKNPCKLHDPSVF